MESILLFIEAYALLFSDAFLFQFSYDSGTGKGSSISSY